jgi:ESX secretion-associated protein EspG
MTLPAETLARLVVLEQLGELHATVKPMAVWRRRRDQEELDRSIRDELAGMGAFDGRGRMDVELAASLTVLTRPAVEFYGWIDRGDRTVGVLAGAIGREAILAVRDGETVELSQIRPEGLAEALVWQTADVPPGRSDPVTFLQSDAVASIGGRRETAAGVGTVPASREIRLAQRIASLPTTGSGQLSVAVRDRLGRRVASDHPLRYADTERGRWINLMTPLPGGDNRVLVAPASRRDLVARLNDLRQALSR